MQRSRFNLNILIHCEIQVILKLLYKRIVPLKSQALWVALHVQFKYFKPGLKPRIRKPMLVQRILVNGCSSPQKLENEEKNIYF